MNLTQIVKMKPITSLHIIQNPSGTYGFVGHVPAELYYVDGATEEQIEKARSFGGRFGPKRRNFETYEAALELAAERGYKVTPPATS